jgi:nitroreductase
MEFRDVIRARRSIRSFSPERPDPALIDEIIDIARRVPTAGFSQGIDFLVVDSPDALDTVWEAGNQEQPDDGPPVLVFVFSDPERYLSRYREGDKAKFSLGEADAWKIKFWDVDASMAAMQLQLAAVDAGIDTWFFGMGDAEEAIRERLGVPADRNLIGIIALGYRAGDEAPIGSATTRKRRTLDEQLHRNRW